MKKHRFSAIALLSVFLSVSLCGCSLTDVGSNGLLRPPKAMGDEAEIQQLIASAAKGEYTLKYPKSGSNRSAIIMNDLDGDSTDEAVAFYSVGEDITKIHMLVMYEKSGEWKLSKDFVTETTDIDCVDFSDVTASGTKEILVGYSTYTQNTNLLSCYSYSNGKTTELPSGQQYSSFYCGDFNSDGKNEVMTLSLFGTENESAATMLEYDDKSERLVSKAAAAMDPNIIKYDNVILSELGEGITGLVVDGEFANGELNTQVIYYNSELSLLRNPLYKEKKPNQTQRTRFILSADLDNDRTAEIPVVSKLNRAGEDSAETVADLVSLCVLSPADEKITEKNSMIVDLSLSYGIKMSSKWSVETVTAVYGASDNTTSFYMLNGNKKGGKLFEIKMFEVSVWDAGKAAEDYTLISKDSKYAYTFNNCGDGDRLSLSDDEIKTAFIALNNTTI